MEAADVIIEQYERIIEEMGSDGQVVTRKRKYYRISYWDEKNQRHLTEPLSDLSYVRWRVAMMGVDPDKVGRVKIEA